TAPPADEEQGTDPQPEEPGNDPQPVEPGAPAPGTTRAEFSLRGDPNFSKSDLTDEQRLWYERIWAAVRNPNANPDMDRLAASDELYYYARAVHSHVQA